MRKALYFEDALDFCDFVRLFGADAKPSVEGQPFELCRVRHPERPRETALVLFNCTPPLTRELGGILTLIDAEIDPGEQTLYWNLENSPSAPLTGETRSACLMDFVELQPWKRNGACRETAGSGPVFFWISGSEASQAEAFTRLIRDNLRLGNDRIQVGRIESKNGGEVLLLRIESPSYFLVQAVLEEQSGSVEVFYPLGGDRFVRWGFTHPLESWWDRLETEPPGEWLFFREGGECLHVDPIVWRDAYQMADLSLDFPRHEVWAESPAAPPRFEVSLSLEQKLSATEPELWLLDEAGVRDLERTLQVTDEESLRAWQIAVQRSELGPDDREWIFIREARAGKKRRHHEFTGAGFARYRGLNNLYLPVSYELQPPLRRDAYGDLFQLQPDTLTVVVPGEQNPECSDASFRILRIRDRAFDTLSSLVDYLVQRDADVLKSLMPASLFDFGHYLKAPRHPGLAPEIAEAGTGRPAEPLADPAKVSEAVPVENPESNASADRLIAPGEAIAESQLGAIQQEELRLEREIIGSGQAVKRWADLLDIKRRLGKSPDAMLCAIEALWVGGDPQQTASLEEALEDLAEAEFSSGDTPATITVDEPDWRRRAAVFALIASRPDKTAELDRWIGEMTGLLQLHGERLRAKDRWLAWRAVLAVNRDLRRETQLREEIVGRITERGLSLEETPAFIRSRIFLDRNEFDGGEGSDPNARAARINLEQLGTSGLAFESEPLRRMHRATLARAWSGLGNVEPATEIAEVWGSGTDVSLSAWELGWLVMAFQKLDPARAASLGANLRESLESVDPETARAIGELREFYEARDRADSPAAFLIRENRGRTYPRGTGTESGLLYELSMDLERQSIAGNELGAVQVMRSMMNIGDTSEYDDPVKLPQFIETLVAGLERFKWGERGTGLIPIFESFSDRAPGFLSTQGNEFYGAILHSNLALGLLTVENLERALGQLRLAAEAVSRNTIELDFIDSAAAVVRTVEQLPLSYRSPFLESLIESFRKLFDIAGSPYVTNERLFAVLVKFLNQLAEAASSKDRLSLEQFRHYQLQDEFLILQRIQSETFCESESRPVNPIHSR